MALWTKKPTRPTRATAGVFRPRISAGVSYGQKWWIPNSFQWIQRLRTSWKIDSNAAQLRTVRSGMRGRPIVPGHVERARTNSKISLCSQTDFSRSRMEGGPSTVSAAVPGTARGSALARVDGRGQLLLLSARGPSVCRFASRRREVCDARRSLLAVASQTDQRHQTRADGSSWSFGRRLQHPFFRRRGGRPTKPRRLALRKPTTTRLVGEHMQLQSSRRNWLLE